MLLQKGCGGINGKIISAKTAPNVTSANMSVAENAEVPKTQYEEVMKIVNIPTPLYLSEAGKQGLAVGWM
jgi:hypothetical protein